MKALDKQYIWEMYQVGGDYINRPWLIMMRDSVSCTRRVRRWRSCESQLSWTLLCAAQVKRFQLRRLMQSRNTVTLECHNKRDLHLECKLESLENPRHLAVASVRRIRTGSQFFESDGAHESRELLSGSGIINFRVFNNSTSTQRSFPTFYIPLAHSPAHTQEDKKKANSVPRVMQFPETFIIQATNQASRVIHLLVNIHSRPRRLPNFSCFSLSIPCQRCKRLRQPTSKSF